MRYWCCLWLRNGTACLSIGWPNTWLSSLQEAVCLCIISFPPKHSSSLLLETKEKNSKNKPAIQPRLTFTSRRAGSPDTFCFILHSAGNGSFTHQGEAGVTTVGDRGAIWVGLLTPTIVLPVADGWRGLTFGNWDEYVKKKELGEVSFHIAHSWRKFSRVV